MDEANRKGINVDIDKLSLLLGIPVVSTSAINNKGIDDLKQVIQDVVKNNT